MNDLENNMILYKSIAFVRDYYKEIRDKCKHPPVRSRLPPGMKGSFTPQKTRRKAKLSIYGTPAKESTKVSTGMYSTGKFSSASKAPKPKSVGRSGKFNVDSKHLKEIKEQDFMNSAVKKHTDRG